MEKLKISYPVIVEGKYDKIKLSAVCEAKIITTDGFAIFREKEKLALIRRLSEKTPVILLTDSDGAGKVIRSHITSAIPKDRLIQLYIPQIPGTEKRKKTPSAEGTLGVEGIEADMLRSILLPFVGEAPPVSENRLSKTDFYIDGLSGGPDSAEKRARFAERAGLPKTLTANALLEAIKILYTYDEYLKMVGRG